MSFERHQWVAFSHFLFWTSRDRVERVRVGTRILLFLCLQLLNMTYVFFLSGGQIVKGKPGGRNDLF